MDVLHVAVHAEIHPLVLFPEVHRLDGRLVVADVAAEPRQIHGKREPLARRREDRVVDRVVDEARRDLADHALAALADEQRVLQERIAPQHGRIGVHRVDVADADALIAVVGEEPREAPADRHPERQAAARRRLRELIEVVNLLLEDLEARREIPVEEERFGEAQRVVLRERPGLHRQRQALAAAEEVRRLE